MIVTKISASECFPDLFCSLILFICYAFVIETRVELFFLRELSFAKLFKRVHVLVRVDALFKQQPPLVFFWHQFFHYGELIAPFHHVFKAVQQKIYAVDKSQIPQRKWAMTQHLPKSGFHWKRVMPTEEQIMKMRPNSKKGWILEVDLEYPAYLHDAHNDYPLAPEKKSIKSQQMSEYQRRLMNGLNLAMPDTEKLVLTLEDKEKYVTHYRNLQFYLRQGMRLKKVHRVIEFDQEPWMASYIMMNTEFRKQAKSNFETDFYKLMNNSVFGKTMENLRNRVDVKIVREWENDKIRKLLSSPSFDRFTIFGNDMAGIHMRKTKLVLNKPVYTGMTILENSKILMYNFFYNHLKARYGQKCGLVYTDTDSLILDIQTEDVYKDMQEHSWMYDTSNYPKENPLYSIENKKALGKMKDECGGRVINEVVAVRPKMYSVEVGEKNVRKAKGVKKCVIDKEITHEHYKEALFEKKQFMHKRKILRSEGHKMYGMCMNKISISPFDTKRWIADDGIHTAAYGHFRLAAAEY